MWQARSSLRPKPRRGAAPPGPVLLRGVGARVVRVARVALACAAALPTACGGSGGGGDHAGGREAVAQGGGGGGGGGGRRIVVFNAGALTRPLRAALDSFAAPSGSRIEQENAGSLQTVRKITELGQIPDVVALADTALFARFLAGRLRGPVVPLGRTRMVLAYTARSRHAAELTPGNWYALLQRTGVETGRSDPTLDPAGYRALFVFQLAERYYAVPGLAAALERAAPARNIRPKSADLVALLQTGNLDYAWEYESVARSAGLRYLRLPPELDLGEADRAPVYRTARVVLPWGRGKPAVTLTGAPIAFGAAALLAAPDGSIGSDFMSFLGSPSGRAILIRHHLEPVQ